MVIKRYLAANQHVEDNTKAPNVDFGASVGAGLEQLGGGKVETAAEGLEVATRGKEVAQTKVNDFDISRLADEDVFDFQVAVDDAVAVAVVEGAGDLTAELAGLLFLELAVGDDVVEHLASIDKLKEHVPVIVCTNDIAKSTDVRVVEEGDDGGFTCGANLFGLVGTLFIGATLVVIVGRAARNNLAGNL